MPAWRHQFDDTIHPHELRSVVFPAASCAGAVASEDDASAASLKNREMQSVSPPLHFETICRNLISGRSSQGLTHINEFSWLNCAHDNELTTNLSPSIHFGGKVHFV